MSIFRDNEKAFKKSAPGIIKMLKKKIGIEGYFLNMIKYISFIVLNQYLI